MALTKEQADQLAELERLRDAPEETNDGGDGDDDGHVIVLRGSRADAFLNSLIGPAPKGRTGNAGSGAGKTVRKRAGSAAEAAEGDGADDDQGDGDDGAGAGDGQQQQDGPPPRANRYFR